MSIWTSTQQASVALTPGAKPRSLHVLHRLCRLWRLSRLSRPSSWRWPDSGWRAHLGTRWRQERGDVPGWVLVTLMTAGLVVALWTVAGATLTQVFLDAIAKVTGAI